MSNDNLHQRSAECQKHTKSLPGGVSLRPELDNGSITSGLGSIVTENQDGRRKLAVLLHSLCGSPEEIAKAWSELRHKPKSRKNGRRKPFEVSQLASTSAYWAAIQVLVTLAVLGN